METIIKQIAGMGLPILGNALGGPLGGAVAEMVSRALGLPDSSPATIGNAINTMPNDIVIQRLKSAENEYVSTIQAQASLGATQVVAISDTIKAELAAATVHVNAGSAGGYRVIEFMQLSWRPLFAYETLFECCTMATIFAHEVWTGDFQTLTAILQFQGFMTWYFSLKFGLLGVYSIGRSAEKVAGPDIVAPPDLITRIIAAVRGKK
jgi:hypothetical protein